MITRQRYRPGVDPGIQHACRDRFLYANGDSEHFSNLPPLEGLTFNVAAGEMPGWWVDVARGYEVEVMRMRLAEEGEVNTRAGRRPIELETTRGDYFPDVASAMKFLRDNGHPKANRNTIRRALEKGYAVYGRLWRLPGMTHWKGTDYERGHSDRDTAGRVDPASGGEPRDSGRGLAAQQAA